MKNGSSAVLTLNSTEDAPQREHSLRDLFDAVRYVARAGCPWRMLPHDLPPWAAVYQQWQRWINAGCMEAMAHDLRMLLRMLSQKEKRKEKKDARHTVLDNHHFRAFYEPMRTSQPADSQSSALEEQLVGIHAKTAPYPAARSWSGGRRRVVGKRPLESCGYHVMSRTCSRV